MQIYNYIHTLRLLVLKIVAIGFIQLMLATPSQSQNIDDQYKNIITTEKDGAKLVLISNLSNEIVAHLKSNNGNLALTDTSVLKVVESADKRVKLYFTIINFTNQPRMLHYFITHKKDGLQYASSFAEEIPPATETKQGHQPLTLSPKIKTDTIDSELFYSYELREGTQKQLIYIPDLVLKNLFEAMALTTNDNEKQELNNYIINRMTTLWKQKETITKPFHSFNRMSVLTSSDKKVRIYTWNTQYQAFSHQFWGAITTVNPDGNVLVQPLIDRTNDIKSAERSTLSAKKWFGAIYYDMVETAFNKQKFYTLIGFKGAGEFTKTKVVDVLTFDGNGEARFGSAILGKGPGFVPRIVYEYALQANMMLKYDADHKMIVMDNLMPSSPIYKDIYMHYGPDFSYNGLKFEKGKWVYYPDIDLRNPKTK